MFERYIGQPLHCGLLPLSLFEINIHTHGQAPGKFASLLHGPCAIQERSDTLCTGPQLRQVFQSELQFNLALYKRLGLKELFILCRNDNISGPLINSAQLSRQDLLQQLSVPEDKPWNTFSVEFYLRDCFGREWLLGQVAVRKCSDCSEKVYDSAGYRLPLNILHAYALGSIERFIAIMLEHRANDLPLWLAPIQVLILPVKRHHDRLGDELQRQLQSIGIRSELSSCYGAIGYKVRDAKSRGIPYLALIDDNDAANDEVSLYTTACKIKSKVPFAHVASYFRQGLLSAEEAD